MESTKKKPTAVKKKKGKVIGQIVAPGVAPEAEDRAQEAAFWDETIASLQSESYATLDEAIHAVVAAAMNKLGQTGDDEQDVREFLYDVLNMDPEILAELRASLDIKA